MLLFKKFKLIWFGSNLFKELSGLELILLEIKKSLAKSSILVNFGSTSAKSWNATILLTSSVSFVWLVIHISILVILIGELM